MRFIAKKILSILAAWRNLSMKYLIFRYYILIALAGCLAAIAAVLNSHQNFNWQLLLPIIGGSSSFVYFIQKQKLEETRLFKELFTSFNERYDRLNETLNNIIIGNEVEDLSLEEKNSLYDYFNLCGEEYFFYKQGYIYPEVWRSWRNGMRIFYKNQKIKNLWAREIENNSYYGFKTELLE